MRYAAKKEMEYLGAIGGRNQEDADLARELGRQLEALRRYDQYFCDGDWRLARNSAYRGIKAQAEH